MDHTKQNKKFAENYKITNDGSLADNFMKGLKKHFTEQDNLTPEQKKSQDESRKHHKKK